MKLLVTTLEADQTLLNVSNSVVTLFETADGSHSDVISTAGLVKGNLFGMCFANNSIYISRDGGINIYDLSYNFIRTIPIPMPSGEIHQIALFNNKIYLTNTKYDSIIVMDLADSSFSEFKIINSNTDTKHVNSIFFENNLIYVCCHNKGLSEIMCYDLNWKLQNMSQGGNSSHGIWRMNGKLWSISSVTNSLHNITDNEQIEIILPTGRTGFFRGVVLSGNQLIFGSSLFRKRMATSVPNVFQDINTDSFCGIVMLNTETYQVEQVFNLPNKTSVLEIVILP